MTFSRDRSLELLRAGTRLLSAEFRDGQEKAIRTVVEHGGS